MIVYFADRQMRILGHASTNLDSPLVIVDDSKEERVENGVSIFDLNVVIKDNPTEFLKIKDVCAEGNYLLCKRGNSSEFYSIIDCNGSVSSRELELYCEDASLDLINTLAEPFEADGAYPLSYYVNKWISGTGFEIGTNEVAHLTRKLKWEGDSTVTERLASIATQFDNTEMSFSFEIEQMRVKKLLVNFWKRKGVDADVRLRINHEVSDIHIKGSVAELATALKAVGGTPEGQQEALTLKGYNYDDGDIFISSDGLLQSRSATRRWCSPWTNYKPIVRRFSFDTTSQSELCNRAVNKLKASMEATRNYEIDIVKLPENVRIGDTIHVVDDETGLYISSRIMKLKRSVTRNEITAELGDFHEEDSGMDAALQQLSERISKIAALKSGADAVTLTITSSNGATFDDDLINTTLTAHIYSSSGELTPQEIAAIGAVKWYKGDIEVASGLTYRISNETNLDIMAKLEKKEA